MRTSRDAVKTGGVVGGGVQWRRKSSPPPPPPLCTYNNNIRVRIYICVWGEGLSKCRRRRTNEGYTELIVKSAWTGLCIW